MTRKGLRCIACLVAVVAAAVLLSGTALAGNGANLNGKFHVSEVVTATQGTGVPDTVGTRSAYTWTFVPTCRFGSCPTSLASSSGLRMRLTNSGSSFTGTSRTTVLCRSLIAPYPTLTKTGYTLVADVQLSPTAVAQGAARRLSGTLTLHYTPTASGRSHNCNPGTEIKHIAATAIAGTVRSALPPPVKHHHKPPPRGGVTGKLDTALRSTIARTLVPITAAFPLNWITLVNAIVALLAMLLVTFPAQIFNRTLDENYEEIRELIGNRLSPLVRFMQANKRFALRQPFLLFLLVMVGGAVIGGFNDPTFGLNRHGVNTLVALLLVFAVEVATAAAVGAGYRRASQLKLSAAPRAIPAGLIVAIACVLVSRLSHFEPGYLYGVIAAVAFAGQLTPRQKGHEVAIASMGTLTVAIVAWIAWAPVRNAATGAHPSTLVLIADTFLAGVFVAGVVSTVINLVPVESLPGRTLFAWHRGVWATTFVVALFLLVEVLIVPAAHIHRETTAPLFTTASLFVAFGAVSVGFNRFFARRHRVRVEAPPVKTPV